MDNLEKIKSLILDFASSLDSISGVDGVRVVTEESSGPLFSKQPFSESSTLYVFRLSFSYDPKGGEADEK